MNKANALRDLSKEELNAELLDTKKELFKHVNEGKQTKKLDKPHLLRENRKKVARIKTILNERSQKEG